jgi:hypothetical protein
MRYAKPHGFCVQKCQTFFSWDGVKKKVHQNMDFSLSFNATTYTTTRFNHDFVVAIGTRTRSKTTAKSGNIFRLISQSENVDSV